MSLKNFVQAITLNFSYFNIASPYGDMDNDFVP
jgi:hypothetical protein